VPKTFFGSTTKVSSGFSSSVHSHKAILNHPFTVVNLGGVY
jgi:hypothetical protein